MTKRAAMYLRVSTGEQTTENQRLALQETAQRRGWEVVAIYEDVGVSGAKGREKRPSLSQMLDDAQRRHFDVLMAWSLDRLGRSVMDLLKTSQHLEACGVDMYLDQQAIDTSTPTGRAFYTVAGAFAELERGVIRERVKAGLARAKEKGTRSGKPIGRPPLSQGTRKTILEARAAGRSLRQTAKDCGVALSTVQRVLASAA